MAKVFDLPVYIILNQLFSNRFLMNFSSAVSELHFNQPMHSKTICISFHIFQLKKLYDLFARAPDFHELSECADGF